MDEIFDPIIYSPKPVLVDFFATSCDPCQMLGPTLKNVKETLGDGIMIIKIDVDKNKQAASRYKIQGLPTMMLIQDGKLLWRQSGVLSKEEIIRTILEKST